MNRPEPIKELDKMISDNHEGKAPRPSVIATILDDLKETRKERNKLIEYINHNNSNNHNDDAYCCCNFCDAFRQTELFKKTGVI